ncbi:MAG: PAS domain S-box protein, partial [Polyangia bacterium]
MYIALDVPVTTLSTNDGLLEVLNQAQIFSAGAVTAAWIIHSQLIVRGPPLGTFPKWLAVGIMAAAALMALPEIGTTGRVLSFYLPVAGESYRFTEPSLACKLLILVHVVVYVAILIRFALAWRRRVPAAAAYCIALVVLVTAVVNDTLVWAGVTHMPLVVDVCYVVPITVGVLSLSGRVIRESALLADLSAGLKEKVEEKTRALQAADAYSRTTLASIGDGLISTTEHGAVELMNPVAERLTGWTAHEAHGRPIAEVFHIVNSKTRAEVDNPVARALRDGIVVGGANHTTLIARDGKERQIAHSCAPIRDADKMLGAVLVFRDVTEDHFRREQLRQSEEQYRVLFQTSRDAIITLAPPSWKFTSGNSAALEMFGVSTEAEFTLLGPWDVSPTLQPDGRPSAERAQEAMREAVQKGANSFHWMHKKVGGGLFSAHVLLTSMQMHGNTVVQATVRDITEQQRLEAELGQARKLEAVGQLAAGIAHEINTPTQFVGDSIQFLADAYKDEQLLFAKYREVMTTLAATPAFESLARQMKEVEESIDLTYVQENAPAAFARALEGVSRISMIVQAMKEFAHPDQREKSPADLNQALQTTLIVGKNEYKYVADVETDLGELPPVLCHVGDLNQVFLNLIVNAAHAIKDVAGESGARGTIRVKTRRDDGSVRIDIADTGTGIPEAIRHRIFDPFFTTREVGKGTGQGLAIARSIVVDKHGGSLTFESEVGKGYPFSLVEVGQATSAKARDGVSASESGSSDGRGRWLSEASTA